MKKNVNWWINIQWWHINISDKWWNDTWSQVEDVVLRETIEQQNRRLREFEERQRLHREELERQAEAEVEVSSH